MDGVWYWCNGADGKTQMCWEKAVPVLLYPSQIIQGLACGTSADELKYHISLSIRYPHFTIISFQKNISAEYVYVYNYNITPHFVDELGGLKICGKYRLQVKKEMVYEVCLNFCGQCLPNYQSVGICITLNMCHV